MKPTRAALAVSILFVSAFLRGDELYRIILNANFRS